MHLLFSSAPAMASTMKHFILLLICYVAFGFEQMPYWQIEEEMETVNVSLPVVLVPVPMDPDRHYAYTRSTVESTTTSPAMPVVSTVTTTTTTTKPPVRCCSSTRAPSSSTRTTTQRTTTAALVPTTTTATTTTTTPATTLFMAASSSTTNDSSRLNTSVPEDYSSTKDDSADTANLLGNYCFEFERFYAKLQQN